MCVGARCVQCCCFVCAGPADVRPLRQPQQRRQAAARAAAAAQGDQCPAGQPVRAPRCCRCRRRDTGASAAGGACYGCQLLHRCVASLSYAIGCSLQGWDFYLQLQNPDGFFAGDYGGEENSRRRLHCITIISCCRPTLLAAWVGNCTAHSWHRLGTQGTCHDHAPAQSPAGGSLSST